MESEISKKCIEEIEVCRHCERLISISDHAFTVKVLCTAEDRFDCPRLRVFYSEEELKMIDEWKRQRKRNSHKSLKP